jgi:hypothetical protein
VTTLPGVGTKNRRVVGSSCLFRSFSHGTRGLDLAKQIVNKAAHFERDKFEDHHESAFVDLINQKRRKNYCT